MRSEGPPRLQQSFQSRENSRPPIRILSIRRVYHYNKLCRHLIYLVPADPINNYEQRADHFKELPYS